jgi:predicted type IV restriction endonuclease
MAVIPKKVQSRFVAGIKKFQPILNAAKTKDINESDTVVIITDMLSELFGFDKYSEITSEYAIKKTFCDLAIKVDGKLRFLIEAKAIGLDLKDEYIKQAIDYGANSGIDWVILSNGCMWRVYKISFAKPIDKEMVYEIDFLKLNYKKQADLDMLYCISKEGLGKSILEEYHIQKQALSRFFIGQIILTDYVIDSIRKILKKVSPDVKVSNSEIKSVLLSYS